MRYLTVLVICFLAACGATADSDRTEERLLLKAGEQLEEILLQDGDVPAGVTGRRPRKKVPTELALGSIPQPRLFRYRAFERNGRRIGSVAVWLYHDAASTERAFTQVVAYIRPLIPGDDFMHIGEERVRAVASRTKNRVALTKSRLLFTRCTALVYSDFEDHSTGVEKIVATYAQRLDTRLTAVACR
jgi:hypothetical protein